MKLPQQDLIDRLRQICREDARLEAAMLYGSFAQGEADLFSDIDTVLFFADASLESVDQRAWIAQIAPVALYYHNAHGIGVAIFESLVRAEFHFYPAEKIPIVETWKGAGRYASLESSLLVDKTGRLTRHLQALIAPLEPHDNAAAVRYLCGDWLNWCLYGTNVLARGELARALEILTVIHRILLQMARLSEGAPERWVSPTRALEQELSPQAYRRYQTCTAPLEGRALWSAYTAAWTWGIE